jgi:type IV pilus assembly protein PilF
MLNLLKMAALVCFTSLIVACASSGSQSEDEQTQVKTAKVNAQLGMAYLERRDIQRAKQKLLLALKQGPNVAEVVYSMAYFQEATGNTEKAQAFYLQAIKVDPTRGEAQNNYGTFLCRAGKYSESIQHFNLAAQDPNYLNPSSAYENAGLCAMKIPDKKQASQYFQRALNENPNLPVASRKLAELNNQSNRMIS